MTGAPPQARGTLEMSRHAERLSFPYASAPDPLQFLQEPYNTTIVKYSLAKPHSNC